jgi:alpha-D-xyloside xylohydrolase
MRFEQVDNTLLWRDGRQTLEVRAWGDDVIRVRATVNPRFADLQGALVADQGTRAHIELVEHEASLQSGSLEARVTEYGRVRFLRTGPAPGVPALPQPLLEEVDWRPSHPPLYPASRSFESLDGDLFRLEARFLAHPGERFFGLGQHRHGLLDQKGAVIELLQRNAEVCIPFLLSSRRYGFLWNNPAIGRVEMGTNGTRWVAEASRQLDYLVLSGDDYAGVLERYADITGHPSPFPEWAAGFWQSKLRYQSQDELLKVAREYRERGLPLSVIVVDYFHWTRQGEWRWDPVAWPDPEAMTRELAEMGAKLMVSIWPTVNPRSENAAEMRERGYLVGTNRGLDVLFPFVDPGEERAFMHYYDATNPEARAFVWDRVRENYLDRGVSLFWLDACEPEIYPVEPRNLRFHQGTGAEVACIYPMLHARGFHEGMKAAGRNEVISLCRSAWAGSQRFGAAVWSGDIPSTWESLRAQVRAGLNIGLSGIPWWTTDIGGFYGGDVTDPHFRELVVRWFQFGTFCPLFRLHGVRNPAPQGASSGADNEVWSFGEDAYRIIRELLFLRERLRPYIVAQMRLASERGTPPMRPLFFDYPDEDELYSVEDEFLFGPDLVVAPVLQAVARTRMVYLPAGAAWKDAWTGRVAPSGTWFEAQAPLERIPVYLREGSPLRLLGEA